MKHFLICEAPICAGGNEKDYGDINWKKNVTWFPDEKICQKSPYTLWQKKQVKLQRFLKKGLLRYPETFYTVELLLSKPRIMQGTKGQDPNRYTSQNVKFKRDMPLYEAKT